MDNIKKISNIKIVFFLLVLCVCMSDFFVVEAMSVFSDTTTPGAIEPPEIMKKYIITDYFDIFQDYEVFTQTSIDEICLPKYSEVVLKEVSSNPDDMIVTFEDIDIEWDVSEYNMSEAGTYTVKGKWVSEKFNIDNEASLIPSVIVKVYSEPAPIKLPDFIKLEGKYLLYELDVAIENCQRIVLWSSIDNGEWKNMEMDFEPGASFSVGDIVINIWRHPSDPYAGILFKNMTAEHTYKYKFELFGGVHSGMTNVLTIAENYSENGENDDKEDIVIGEDTDDSGGKRTGGGQYNLEANNDKIKISKKQLKNYMMYNPKKTLFQVGKVKIVMPYDAVKNLFDITSEYVQIEINTEDNNKYEIKLLVDGKLSHDFNDNVEIHFPYKKLGEKKASIKDYVDVIKDEKPIFGYIDDKSDFIVTFSSLEGVFEIVPDTELKSKNMEYSRLLEWIRFLLWMMTDIH